MEPTGLPADRNICLAKRDHCGRRRLVATGAVIGPYKLLEQIGEGGFGVVFMAEQQQLVRRKVAPGATGGLSASAFD